MNFIEAIAAQNKDLPTVMPLDFFSYLLGKSQASPTKTITGVPPFTFKSNGNNLVDWSISGTAGGVGDRTKNYFPIGMTPTAISAGVTLTTSDMETGTIEASVDGSVSGNYKSIRYNEEPTIFKDGVSYTISATVDSITGDLPNYALIGISNGTRLIYSCQTRSVGEKSQVFTYDSSLFPEEVRLMIFFTNTATMAGTIKLSNIMIRESSTSSEFEPYGYKIPVTCGGETTNIFIGENPLAATDTITKASTGVDIPTVNGSNTLTVDTTVQPSEMSITYHRGDRKEHYIFHLDPTTAEIIYPKGSANADFEPARMTADGFNYGSWENAFFMPKPCMLKSNGKVDYYLDPNDYSKKLDGTASDIADPTYDGNVMMEFPKIWYKFVPTGEDGEGGTFHCSNVKLDDDYECWCNYDANNNEIDHFYVAAYNAVILDSKMRSLSGYALTQENGADSTTVTDEIAAARANNQNGIDEWYTYLLADHQLLTYLATLICKHVNHQAKFGRGIDSDSTAAKRAYVTGTLNDKGLFWGDTSSGTQAVKIFGIENFYACVWKRTAGLIGTSTGYAYKLTHGTKDGSTATSFNTTGSGYKTLARTRPANGYVTTMRYEANGFWIPATTGTNRYGDYHWTGNGYVLVGGSSNFGAYCGSWCVRLDRGVSSSDWHFSSALSCKPRAVATAHNT